MNSTLVPADYQQVFVCLLAWGGRGPRRGNRRRVRRAGEPSASAALPSPSHSLATPSPTTLPFLPRRASWLTTS